MRRRTIRLGSLIFTTVLQAANPPLVDKACVRDEQDGQRFRGKAILLTPWRRNRYGNRPPYQLALVVALAETEE